MATLTHPAREANRADANRTYVTAPDAFVNEPMIDWTNPENLRRMQAASSRLNICSRVPVSVNFLPLP